MYAGAMGRIDSIAASGWRAWGVYLTALLIVPLVLFCSGSMFAYTAWLTATPQRSAAVQRWAQFWMGTTCVVVVLEGATIVLAIAVLTRRTSGRTRRGPDGRCVECGYDLAGLRSGVCPECGASYGK